MKSTTALSRSNATLVLQQLQRDLSILELQKAAGVYNRLSLAE